MGESINYKIEWPVKKLFILIVFILAGKSVFSSDTVILNPDLSFNIPQLVYIDNNGAKKVYNVNFVFLPTNGKILFEAIILNEVLTIIPSQSGVTVEPVTLNPDLSFNIPQIKYTDNNGIVKSYKVNFILLPMNGRVVFEAIILNIVVNASPPQPVNNCPNDYVNSGNISYECDQVSSGFLIVYRSENGIRTERKTVITNRLGGLSSVTYNSESYKNCQETNDFGCTGYTYSINYTRNEASDIVYISYSPTLVKEHLIIEPTFFIYSEYTPVSKGLPTIEATKSNTLGGSLFEFKIVNSSAHNAPNEFSYHTGCEFNGNFVEINFPSPLDNTVFNDIKLKRCYDRVVAEYNSHYNPFPTLPIW